MFSSPATHSQSSTGVDHNPSVEPPPDNANSFKRKRRPAGTPDPDAEVVALSPRTLMESDRYLCEICGQGFQRDQNLQMHRRRHKVPWKLLKRSETGAGEAVRKRVFVCPEPSCLHHDPCHALGDLVGIKKHFRRKHSTHKQWSCSKCSKAYAVQSDFKAHLKTCGTRGHSCDCGRVFSRVESFIEHQDACNAGRARTELRVPPPPLQCLSRTASSTSPSSETNFSTTPTWPAPRMPNPTTLFLLPDLNPSPSSKNHPAPSTELRLQLSVGPTNNQLPAEPIIIKEAAMDQLRVDKARADEMRLRAKQQVELAEAELTNAKRIRQQAQAELSRALAMRDQATKKINAVLLEITCHACKQRFRAMAASADDNSIAASYISSVLTEGEGEGEGDDQRHHNLPSP